MITHCKITALFFYRGGSIWQVRRGPHNIGVSVDGLDVESIEIPVG